MWAADVLFNALKHAELRPKEPWLIAGDFNLCETFDTWKGGPRGNKEYLNRMKSIGLTECLRYTTGKLTPTFRKSRGGQVINQIDYLWATETLKKKLVACFLGDATVVFDKKLSDHLPIVADFKTA